MQTINHRVSTQHSGSRRSLHSHRRSVHERIQSHRVSKRNSRHSISQSGKIMVPTKVSDYDNYPTPKYVAKHETITTVSGMTEKSNGSRTFNKNKTYQEKMYNDKRMTYTSGMFNKTAHTFNRTLRDRNTFFSIFPNYRIAKDQKRSTMKYHFIYPRKSIDGRATHNIDRTHTRKMDPMKKYTEEMLKIASMKREVK
ncbi:unnamed protein product [Moneuplotes crassus]|uniref:Uncharacterized protein n=1 Tax=Euplotes crassus TaxID=5936 RepID=A0AAD2D4G3_EUPCR|nr:unnamed protein product [Moneuplotes crassus]